MSKKLLMMLESDQANLKNPVYFVKESKSSKHSVGKTSETYEDLLQSSVMDILNDTIPDVIMQTRDSRITESDQELKKSQHKEQYNSGQFASGAFSYNALKKDYDQNLENNKVLNPIGVLEKSHRKNFNFNKKQNILEDKENSHSGEGGMKFTTHFEEIHLSSGDEVLEARKNDQNVVSSQRLDSSIKQPSAKFTDLDKSNSDSSEILQEFSQQLKNKNYTTEESHKNSIEMPRKTLNTKPTKQQGQNISNLPKSTPSKRTKKLAFIPDEQDKNLSNLKSSRLTRNSSNKTPPKPTKNSTVYSKHSSQKETSLLGNTSEKPEFRPLNISDLENTLIVKPEREFKKDARSQTLKP